MFNTAKGAAALSLLANATLVGLKLGVGLAIGSISVLSDALDSGMDLVGAFVALLAIRFAARPADRGHPYGHGKMENFSGVIEAFLILAAGVFITYEAAHRLQTGTTIKSVELGIAAMGISLGINLGVSLHLRRVARKTGSPALEAAAWHRASDIVTSAGVLLGLIIIQLSPWKFLDPVVAIAVAAFVIWTAFRLLGRTLADLLDVRLPEAEEALVRQVLESFAGEYVGYHGMRTRRSGRQRQIDLHLVMPRVTTVAAAHDLTDKIEAAIEQRLPESVTTIHVEPCDVSEEECAAHCPAAEVPYCHLLPWRAPEERAGPEHVGRSVDPEA